MTGFGWDPTHSIVKARQEGLQTVLYKPFRADRLMDAVEQALRTTPPPRHSSSPAPGWRAFTGAGLDFPTFVARQTLLPVNLSTPSLRLQPP